jgi:hypothetical protein
MPLRGFYVVVIKPDDDCSYEQSSFMVRYALLPKAPSKESKQA